MFGKHCNMVLFLSVEFFLPKRGEIIVKMLHAEYQGDVWFHSIPCFLLHFPFPPFFISCPSSVFICHTVAIKH